MTDAERTKLSGIASGANNYSHPASHPASMIEESTTRKFMTDAEKTLLSSLGTNAALKDFSNVTTKSLSQNGYYKLPDGLLIQWGTGGNGVNQIVYFPTSFYNTSYVVVTTAISSVMNSIVKMINGKNISYFKVYSVGPTIEAGEIFGWIAIGRWK